MDSKGGKCSSTLLLISDLSVRSSWFLSESKNRQALFMSKRKLVTTDSNKENLNSKNADDSCDDFHLKAKEVVPNLYSANLTLLDQINIVFDNLQIKDKSEEFYLTNIQFLRHKIWDYWEDVVEFIVDRNYLTNISVFFVAVDNDTLVHEVLWILANMLSTK